MARRSRVPAAAHEEDLGSLPSSSQPPLSPASGHLVSSGSTPPPEKIQQDETKQNFDIHLL